MFVEVFSFAQLELDTRDKIHFMKGKFIVAMAIIVVVIPVIYLIKFQDERHPIGGDRDKTGCLIAAGYSFNSDIGACARIFEMTPDIIQAAKIAVDYVGTGYALTVTAFNSYEESGSYDIFLERGEDRFQETVYIRNGKISKSPQ